MWVLRVGETVPSYIARALEIGVMATPLPPSLAFGFAQEFHLESLGAEPACQSRGPGNKHLDGAGH